jgi:ATP-binding cassette subfamily C protein LapB
MKIQEGGRGLSGGQRSLVGITRMLLQKPQIWLLDEPTANLDLGAEASVLEAIDAALPPGSILVIVTHKIQLLSRFSRVIGLQRGNVVLDGPSHQVLASFAQRPATGQAPHVARV